MGPSYDCQITEVCILINWQRTETGILCMQYTRKLLFVDMFAFMLPSKWQAHYLGPCIYGVYIIWVHSICRTHYFGIGVVSYKHWSMVGCISLIKWDLSTVLIKGGRSKQWNSIPLNIHVLIHKYRNTVYAVSVLHYLPVPRCADYTCVTIYTCRWLSDEVCSTQSGHADCVPSTLSILTYYYLHYILCYSWNSLITDTCAIE